MIEKLSQDELLATRSCKCCGQRYTLASQLEDRNEYQPELTSYDSYWLDYCLQCFETDDADAHREYMDEMSADFENCPIDEYSRKLERICKEPRCKVRYTIGDTWRTDSQYFEGAWNYQSGCKEYCLSCWLGVGPGDQLHSSEVDEPVGGPSVSHAEQLTARLDSPRISDAEFANTAYEFLCEGDLKSAYKPLFDMGMQVAILPLDRVQIHEVVALPNMMNFFPAGVVDLDSLNLNANSSSACALSQVQAEASQVTQVVVGRYPLAVFPCRVELPSIWERTHDSHMSILRQFSEAVETEALNLFRYRECRIHRMEDLPCRPGQVPSSNTMMSGMILFDGKLGYGNVFGGAAFGSVVTRGLGMEISQLDWTEIPRAGEVGNLVRRGLTLYAELLDSHSETSKFVQAMSLLEFLAYPDQYTKMQKVKMVIAKYFTADKTPERTRLEARFMELTGGVKVRDGANTDDRGKPVMLEIPGVRTRIVHHGDRIEQILDEDERSELFRELDGYIRPILSHMIKNSGLSFDEYCEIREKAFLHVIQ